MKTLAVSLILLTSLLACAEMTKCPNPETRSNIKDKTKLLKTFTIEYWKVASVEVTKLPVALQQKGFVAGDFHFNNVGLYYNYLKSKPELVLNDFDDAGVNFLLVDIMKYITYVKKTDKEIDLDAVFKKYQSGLSRTSELTLPVEFLNEAQFNFNKNTQKYLTNKKEEFAKFDKSKITSEQNSKIQTLLRLNLITQLANVEYMVTVNDSGSSKDMERYAFLGQDRNGTPGLIEFKKLKCSATGAAPEQDLTANFDYIRDTYLKNFSPLIANQYVYRLRDETFLVRQKSYNPLKNLEIEIQPTQELQKYANFFAEFLGTIHAKSANKAYINGLATHEAQILKLAKQISKKFNDSVKD